MAARGQYKLELTLTSDLETRRPFVYEVIMNRREYINFNFNKRKATRKELIKAQKALAIKRGYIPQVYGKDYYKLIRVTSWSYKVTELDNDRVVTQGKGR